MLYDEMARAAAKQAVALEVFQRGLSDFKCWLVYCFLENRPLLAVRRRLIHFKARRWRQWGKNAHYYRYIWHVRSLSFQRLIDDTFTCLSVRWFNDSCSRMCIIDWKLTRTPSDRKFRVPVDPLTMDTSVTTLPQCQMPPLQPLLACQFKF